MAGIDAIDFAKIIMEDDSLVISCKCKNTCSTRNCPCRKHGKKCRPEDGCKCGKGKLTCKNVENKLSEEQESGKSSNITSENGSLAANGGGTKRPASRKGKKITTKKSKYVANDSELTISNETIQNGVDNYKSHLKVLVETLDRKELEEWCFRLAQKIPEADTLLNNIRVKTGPSTRTELESEEPSAADEEPNTTIRISSGNGGGVQNGVTSSIKPFVCICGNCRPMPTADENVCCMHFDCVTAGPLFALECLLPAVLVLTMRLRHEGGIVRGLHNLENKNYRHAAYRNFTLWQYGFLGQGRRLAIPSCCVLKIRSEFPEANGVYVGFVRGRLPF